MVLACVHVGCQQMCAHTEAEEKSILYESWCTILGKKRGLGHHGAHSRCLTLCLAMTVRNFVSDPVPA